MGSKLGLFFYCSLFSWNRRSSFLFPVFFNLLYCNDIWVVIFFFKLQYITTNRLLRWCTNIYSLCNLISSMVTLLMEIETEIKMKLLPISCYILNYILYYYDAKDENNFLPSPIWGINVWLKRLYLSFYVSGKPRSFLMQNKNKKNVSIKYKQFFYIWL